MAFHCQSLGNSCSFIHTRDVRDVVVRDHHHPGRVAVRARVDLKPEPEVIRAATDQTWAPVQMKRSAVRARLPCGSRSPQ